MPRSPTKLTRLAAVQFSTTDDKKNDGKDVKSSNTGDAGITLYLGMESCGCHSWRGDRHPHKAQRRANKPPFFDFSLYGKSGGASSAPFCRFMWGRERLSFPVSVFFDYSVVILRCHGSNAESFPIRPKPSKPSLGLGCFPSPKEVTGSSRGQTRGTSVRGSRQLTQQKPEEADVCVLQRASAFSGIAAPQGLGSLFLNCGEFSHFNRFRCCICSYTMVQ